MNTIDGIWDVVRRYPAELALRAEFADLPRGGFSSAAVLRLESDTGESYALRRWGNRRLNQRRLRGLHRLLAWIADAGVSQVAVPVADQDGRTFSIHDGYCWQLEPWKPGAADFRNRPNRERLRDSMRRLADWHRAAARFSANADEKDWFDSAAAAPSPTVSERLRKIDRWMRDGVPAVRRCLASEAEFLATVGSEFADLSRGILRGFEAAAPHVAAELQRIAAEPFRLQPCLRDVWHDHVLFTGDAVTGLIDPTACRAASIATDIVRLVGSLVADDRAEWEFALDCYAAAAGLADRERDLVRVLDRSAVLLSGMTWLDRVLLQRQRPRYWAAVLERLQRIARRLAALCGFGGAVRDDQ